MEDQLFPCFVNVYHVTQEYGGHEEGDWWFFAGDPLESIKVKNEVELEATLTKLRGDYELKDNGDYLYKDDYDHPNFDRDRNRKITSSCGRGFEYQIKVEDEFAQAFPKHQPHYE